MGKDRKKKYYGKNMSTFDRPYAYTEGTILSNPDIRVHPANENNSPYAIPFDSYRYHYYQENLPTNISTPIARDQSVWRGFWMMLATGGVEYYYVPTAINGGVDAHKLAVDVDHRVARDVNGQQVLYRTIEDLDKSLAGSTRIKNDVIDPNERAAMGRRERLSRAHPTRAMIFPAALEGAVRAGRKDPDASFGRSPEDEDFMEGHWYAVIDKLNAAGSIHERDMFWSRNANWESMRAIVNQLGLFDGVTRDGDLPFRTIKEDGSIFTLAETLQETLEYMVYALKNEFYAAESATCLAWMLEIDQRLRDPEYNENSAHPLDRGRLSRQLRDEYISNEPWAVEAREKMDLLRPIAEKLLFTHFIGHIPEEYMSPLGDRFQTVRENLKPVKLQPLKKGELAQRPVSKPLDKLLRDAKLDPADVTIAAIIERITHPEHYKAQDREEPPQEAVGLRAIATPRFEAAPTGMAQSPHAGPSPIPHQVHHLKDMFDEDKLKQEAFGRSYLSVVRSKREQLAVRYALGGMLAVTPPRARPAWTFVIGDMKRGQKGREVLDEIGGTDIDELPQILGEGGIEREVVTHNIELVELAAEIEKERQKDQYGISGPILTTVDTHVTAKQAYKKLDHITAVEDGRAALSSEAVMAIDMGIIDFMADTVCFADPEWANSQESVCHMVRATRVQLGLVDRGYMYKYDMKLKDHQGENMSLFDRLKPLAKEVEHCVETGKMSPDHARAAAILVQVYEQMVSPDYNDRAPQKAQIDFNMVDDSFSSFRYDAKLRKEMNALVYGRKDGETELEKKGLRQYVLENCSSWLEYSDLERDLDFDFYWWKTRGIGETELETAHDLPEHRLRVGGPGGVA